MSRVQLFSRFAIVHVPVVAILLIANFAVAQSPENYSASGPFYQPVSTAPVELGFTQHHASTAAEGYLRGRAAVIQALGNYQVNESQADILRQQARSLDRENDLRQTAALHTQRKMWVDARVQQRKDRDARRAEGQQRIAVREATVYRQTYQLSANDLDTTTGQISWPAALQSAKFELERSRLETLFRDQAYGQAKADASSEIARSINLMTRSLRSEIGAMPRDEYLASQKFLLGLKYASAEMEEAA